MGRAKTQSELEGMANKSSGRSVNPSGETKYDSVREMPYTGRSKKPIDYKN